MTARSCNIDVGPDIGNCWVHDVCSTLRENRKAKQSSRTFSLIFILWRNSDVFIWKKSRDPHFLPFSKELYCLCFITWSKFTWLSVNSCPKRCDRCLLRTKNLRWKAEQFYLFKALSWLYKKFSSNNKTVGFWYGQQPAAIFHIYTLASKAWILFRWKIEMGAHCNMIG